MLYFAFSSILGTQCVFFLNISLKYAIIQPTVCVDDMLVIILCAGWIKWGSFLQVMIFSTNCLLSSIESSSSWRCVLHNIHLGGDPALLYTSKSKQLVLLFLRGNLCLQRWSIHCEQIYDGKQTSISCWNYLHGLRWI